MDTHCQEYGHASFDRRVHVLRQTLHLRVQQGSPWRTRYNHCQHRRREGRNGAQMAVGDSREGAKGRARREHGLLRQHEADSTDGIPKCQCLARPLSCAPGLEQVLHEGFCRRARQAAGEHQA